MYDLPPHPHPTSTLCPYTTLFRSSLPDLFRFAQCYLNGGTLDGVRILGRKTVEAMTRNQLDGVPSFHWSKNCINSRQGLGWGDRKSTRLNSSHVRISYAVFCLKKK